MVTKINVDTVKFFFIAYRLDSRISRRFMYFPKNKLEAYYSILDLIPSKNLPSPRTDQLKKNIKNFQ